MGFFMTERETASERSKSDHQLTLSPDCPLLARMTACLSN